MGAIWASVLSAGAVEDRTEDILECAALIVQNKQPRCCTCDRKPRRDSI